MRSPWFRSYSDDILRDPKLKAMARATKRPKVVLIGAWTILLALAADSPTPGILLLVEGVPLTLSDLGSEMGLDPKTTSLIIEHLIEYEMLSYKDDLYWVVDWPRFQLKSDSSTERTREYRSRMKDIPTQERHSDGHGDGHTDTPQGPPSFPPLGAPHRF